MRERRECARGEKRREERLLHETRRAMLKKPSHRSSLLLYSVLPHSLQSVGSLEPPGHQSKTNTSNKIHLSERERAERRKKKKKEYFTRASFLFLLFV